MSAINPLPASGASGDKRSYEPSMEEILASIRRIIADDQGIPMRGGPIGNPASMLEASHELLRIPVPHAPVPPSSADPASTPTTAFQAPAPSEPASPQDDPAVSVADEEPALADASQAPVAHGPIAAPQYPSPDGGIGGATHIARDQAPPEPALFAALAETVDEPAEERPSDRDQAPAAGPVETKDELFDKPIEPKPAADQSPLFSASTEAAVSAAFNMLAASRLADNSQELMNIAREMIRPMLRAWLDDNLPGIVERLVRAEIERVARGGR